MIALETHLQLRNHGWIREVGRIIQYMDCNTDISKYLRLPPVKLHCSMLAEDANKSAIADIEKKQEL